MFYVIVFLITINAVYSEILHPISYYDAVTPTQDVGRFGDRLIGYIQAKWVSFRYGIPLLYYPFDYSDELVLSLEEIDLREAFTYFHPSKILICPFFPDCRGDIQCTESHDRTIIVDYSNSEFMSAITKMITPIRPLHCIKPPQGHINIAIHIREGGGFDPQNLSMYAPSKSPPLDFYIHSLNAVLPLLESRPIYCYIFTDAKDPRKLAQYLQTHLSPNDSLIFDWRKDCNSHNTNVLEDFFSFQNFDILIRPDSNFSIVPSLLHKFAITCSPSRFGWASDGQPYTEEIKITICEKLLQDTLKTLDEQI